MSNLSYWSEITSSQDVVGVLIVRVPKRESAFMGGGVTALHFCLLNVCKLV